MSILQGVEEGSSCEKEMSHPVNREGGQVEADVVALEMYRVE